jgi:hypothetical protein
LELEGTNNPDKQSLISYDINNVVPYLHGYNSISRPKNYKMIFNENHYWIGRDMKNTFYPGFFMTFGTRDQQINTITSGTRHFLEMFNLRENQIPLFLEHGISFDKIIPKSLIGTSNIKVMPISNDEQLIYRKQDLAVWILIK